MKTKFAIIATIVSFSAFAQGTSVNADTNPNDHIAFSVNENQTTNLKTFGAKDGDGADNITLTLTGTDAASFVINPASANITAADGDIGSLELASGLSFDVDVQDTYEFSVTATDDDGLAFTAPVILSVQGAGIDSIVPYHNYINENVTGIHTFPLSIKLDNGSTNNGGQWTLNSVVDASGIPVSGFSINNQKDLVLDADVVTLDAEANDLYTANITVVRGNATITQDVLVHVNDLNESPYEIYVK